MAIRINAIHFFLFILALSASLLFLPGPALAESGNASKAEKKDATARIEKIQFRSNARYTRMVILLDKQARFEHTLQSAPCPDTAAACIKLVLQHSRPDKTVDDRYAIGDEILNQAVISQDPPDTVVLIGCNQFQDYKIFSLENPARIVIDVWGRSPATADRQNASGVKDMADLNAILGDLMDHSKVRESETLARQVQQNLYRRLKQRNQNVNNRGVKQAPFYVLLGADMPAILTQVGFLTNPAECRLLARDDYQEEVSNGIVTGIRAYMQSHE